MSRLHFTILTTLSGIVAFCVLTQFVVLHVSSNDAARLRDAQQKLQQGQLCFNTWKSVVNRVGQVAQTQNDQALKDVLTRQGLQIKSSSETTPAPATPAPSTH